MTRDERIAAGWVECWGVYDWSDGQWRGLDRSFWAGPRIDFRSASSASREAASYAIGSVVARRFWRRKKPKAPPRLTLSEINGCFMRTIQDAQTVAAEVRNRLEDMVGENGAKVNVRIEVVKP